MLADCSILCRYPEYPGSETEALSGANEFSVTYAQYAPGFSGAERSSIPEEEEGGASYGAAYAVVGIEMRLQVWAPKDCGTSACIRSIVNMVLMKLIMFVRRADSSRMIHVGSNVMMTGSSASMSPPSHTRTDAWRGWLGFSRTCRPVRQYIF